MKNFFKKSKVIIMSILSLVGLIAIIGKLFSGNSEFIVNMSDLNNDLDDAQDEIDNINDQLDSIDVPDLSDGDVCDYWSDL